MSQSEFQPQSEGLEVKSVMPGAEVIHCGALHLAVGFPEEVVKAWMLAKTEVNAWLIPDVRSAHGIAQWALEFPLYYALFVKGTFGRGEKIPVVVSRSDWPDVVRYLRLTLLGLRRDELVAAGCAPTVVEYLSRETEHLALKRKDGVVAEIEDFLEPIFYDDQGVATLAGLSIRRHGDNTWSFFSDSERLEEHHLAVPAGQEPPYAGRLPRQNRGVRAEAFELVMLGTSNGFDPHNPCSNMVVQAHGRYVLVDAGPYIRTMLEHAGLSLSQLSAVVITHAHEDHAVGLSALLGMGHRPRLFVSRENAVILRDKLAILNPQVLEPQRLLDDAFELTLVEPGVDYDHFGLGLRFHHTFHSIPCTGVELSMAGAGGHKRLLVVGDNDCRAHLDTAATAGIFAPERLAALHGLYAWRGDLVVADAGGGAIHGATVDFADCPSPVVYLHTGKLAEAEQLRYTLARTGDRYRLLVSEPPSHLERGLAQRALAQTFAGADADWLMALLDGAELCEANAGHLVLRQGDAGRDAFIVLAGELEVFDATSQPATRLGRIEAGEVFGERAAVAAAPRAATVVAATPVRMLRLGGELLGRFVEAQSIASSLPELWHRRRIIDATAALRSAPAAVRNELARLAVRRTVEPGATLIRERSSSSTVFVLAAGRVQVYKGDAPLLVGGAPVILDPGTLLGETGPFLQKARNASIVSLDECEVLALRGTDFRRIVESCPALFCDISRVVKTRRAA